MYIEGDSEKSSRNEKEGPLLILACYFFCYDGRKRKAGIAEIIKQIKHGRLSEFCRSPEMRLFQY